MDSPVVEDGYYFVILYKVTERPIDGEVQIGKYSEGYWELMGHDIGIPSYHCIEVIGERIELPTMKY